MDINKAKRLITKIQSFIDHEPSQELSRLERDLLKSYIQQLYDAVTDDQPVPAKQAKPEITYIEPPVYKPEPHKIEVPPIVPEINAKEPEAIPMEIKYPEKEMMTPEHKIEHKVEYKSEYKPAHVDVEIPVQPKKEQQHYAPVAKSYEEKGDLNKLFDLPKSQDHFSHMPIDNIQGAMGLNERIFTLKELFGGDKSLFDETCQRLNELSSYADARNMLMNGVARDYHWADMERIKMAEQFLRIVARRYPKT